MELQKIFEDLYENQTPERLDFTSFRAFHISDYRTMNAPVVQGFDKGQKCVFSLVSNMFIDDGVQIAFRDAAHSNACRVVYVCFFAGSIGVFAHIHDQFHKVMREYGRRRPEGWQLNLTSSANKFPLFTRLFQTDMQTSKPYLMIEDNTAFVAQMLQYDAVQTDRDFFNAVGGLLTVAEKLNLEIVDSRVGESSFAKDLLQSLSLYLRLNGAGIL